MPRATAPRTIASYGAQPLSGYAAGSVALKLGLAWLLEAGAMPRQLTRTLTMSTPRLLISSRRASRCAWSPPTSTLSSWIIVGIELLAEAVAAMARDATSASTTAIGSGSFLICEPPSARLVACGGNCLAARTLKARLKGHGGAERARGAGRGRAGM